MALPHGRALDRVRMAAFCVLWLCAAAPAASAATTSASAAGAWHEERPRVRATLLVHPDDDAAGGNVRVGVLLELDPGWHVYWRNPGETGLPTEVRWTVPGGAAGPVAWPAPREFREGDLRVYGYEDRVMLVSEVRPPAGAAGRVRADVDLLACEHQCVPASLAVERSLDDRGGDRERTRALFDQAARALPRPPAELGLGLEARLSQSALRPGDAFTAWLGVFACDEAAAAGCDAVASDVGAVFFPEAGEGLALDVAAVSAHSEDPRAFWIELRGKAGAPPLPEPLRLRGVVSLLGTGGVARHAAVDLPLPQAPAGARVEALPGPARPIAAAPGPGPTAAPSLATALVLALLGGLILNAMPCVLPVLAIKAFGLAELAHRPRREAWLQGLAYLAGIQLSLAALAAGVLALRAAGSAVGWGFQFQEPLFVTAVCAVLVLFALNLFGVYEITPDTGRLGAVGQSATGARRSFFEGLLAVVLATPCSAPFLGTAVGLAFASPPAVILAIFAAIGLGLAAPYLLLSALPAWRRFVPRPGPWMLHLRAGLGFLLLASVVWLLWILGRGADPAAVVRALSALWVLGVAAWIHGALQRAGSRGTVRAGVAAATLLTALAVNAVAVRSAAPPLASEPWAPQRVERALDEGRVVFSYFTADWCLTCKANERTVLADPRVREALSRTAVLRADWTRRDETIRAALAGYGRAGVPAYVVHHPDRPGRPELLPELLSVDAVLTALGRGTGDR